MSWAPDELRRALQREYPDAKIIVHPTKIDSARAMSLDMLIVPESQRGVGIGTKIVRAICAYADRHGALILLSPFTEHGVRYKNRLVRWYKTFGFIENKGRRRDFRFRETMYRLPVQA